ncbi:MAG: hypothetical protein CMK89_00215 [Pseudomonadales bacterium]|jgi:serine protease inhibitor|nr:hypothetical protein [Pseudomonadales bacterium]
MGAKKKTSKEKKDSVLRFPQVEEKTLRQVKLPLNVRDAVEAYATDESVLIQDVYNSAIEWFLKLVAKKKPGSYYYLMSPKDADNLSIWVKTKTLNRIKILAERDSTWETRIIFTAVVYYLNLHGYLQDFDHLK